MAAVDDDAVELASVRAWAVSGAMALTGPPDGPGLGPPRPLVPRLRSFAELLARRSRQLGTEVRLDPLGVLTERAAIAGLRRRGQVSCGGASRLVRAADGWLAVTLAREDDIAAVPAWLALADADGVVRHGSAAGPPDAPDEVWHAVARGVRSRTAADLVTAAAVLGMPVGALPAPVPEPPSTPSPLTPLPTRAVRVGDAPPTADLAGVVVVDLTSLWAGPLAGALLADAGARVVKVESRSRPDGARRGPPAFFDLMNARKASVAVDLGTDTGRRMLRALLTAADVVVEASRPRALEQLGIVAEDLLGNGRPRVWVSITGHGRELPGGERVGFGDDAAVAGGLVAWDGESPSFCADACADPATGLVAAAAALDALAVGGRWLLDLSLAGVAASLAGPTCPVPSDLEPADPVAPRLRGRARELGVDTGTVLAELAAR